MDPLLDLLRAMEFTGAVFLDADLSAPWGIASQVSPADASAFIPAPVHVIAYHYVTEGHCVLRVDGLPPIQVGAGAIVMLPRNDPHQLASGSDVRAVTIDHLIQPATDGGLSRIVYGGGGERARLLCGYIGVSTPNPPIVSILPPALTIAVADGVAGHWIESSFKFAAQELVSRRQGSPTVAVKLAELLFIEAVRRHVASLPPDSRGWLAGLRDPIVGRALGLIHERTSHRWTVPELAHECGASRSAFADRFTSLMGESPIRYAARQRLNTAAQRLKACQDSVASVAFAIGFESEAAFSRAFKREFGKSPAAWRKT